MKSEWFPKDSGPRLADAYFYLILFGTFGVHQFYLKNKSRGLYLLVTCGFSHLMLLLTYLGSLPNTTFGFKITAIVIGYLLGGPVWIWDLITLRWQVQKNSQSVQLI